MRRKYYLNLVPTEDIIATTKSDQIAKSSGIVPDINETSSGSGWSLVDKILGTTEKVVDIYTYVKTGEKPDSAQSVVSPSGTKISVGRVEKEKDWTGLTKPWGTVIVASTVLLVGIAIYKMSKKK